MNVTVKINSPAPPVVNPVTEPDLYWILPQYLPSGYIGKSLSLALARYARTGDHCGYPTTIKGFENYKIPMVPAHQELWFGLLYDYASPTQKQDMVDLKKQWSKLTSDHLAFCNGFGSELCWDTINKTHVGAEYMKQETITCDGNFVKRAGENFSYKGRDYMPTETINVMKPLPSVSSLRGKFWLVHRAMVIRTERVGDGYMVNPFDHLRGYPVPVPWVNREDTNALPADRLLELHIGDPMPSYYNPPR